MGCVSPPSQSPCKARGLFLMHMAEQKRATKTYTERERLGTLFLALREGVVSASRTTKVPQRTIYQWFEDAGGVAEVRGFVSERAVVALSRAEAAVCEEVVRRAAMMGDNDLMITFRELLRVRAESAGAIAGAAAQTNVSTTVVNINE